MKDTLTIRQAAALAALSALVAGCGGGGSGSGGGALPALSAGDPVQAPPPAAAPQSAAPAPTVAAAGPSGEAIPNGLTETCSFAQGTVNRWNNCVAFKLFAPQIVVGTYVGTTGTGDVEQGGQCSVTLEATGVVTMKTSQRTFRLEPGAATKDDIWSSIDVTPSYYLSSMFQVFWISNTPAKVGGHLNWSGASGQWKFEGRDAPYPGVATFPDVHNFECFHMQAQMDVPPPIASAPILPAEVAGTVLAPYDPASTGSTAGAGTPATTAPPSGTSTPPDTAVKVELSSQLVSNGAFNLWRIAVGNPNSYGVRCLIQATYRYADPNGTGKLVWDQATRSVTVPAGGTG